MKRIANGKRDKEHPNRPTLAGLSAPQIGERLRIILVDIAADPSVSNFKPELVIFINPRVIETSKTETAEREGCYSTGEICGKVFRPGQVTIEALNEDGDKLLYKSKNSFESHIIQHEIDHLDGVRFPSRVRSPKHLHRVNPDDFQKYREGWRTWNKYYPFDQWLKMYDGEKIQDSKFARIVPKNYQCFIETLPGSSMWRHLYVTNQNGDEIDVTENGNKSCAYMVSSVLYIFKLIDEPHATVKTTLEHMVEAGWEKVNKPTKGAIVRWEQHMGFYLDNDFVISNNSDEGFVTRHGLIMNDGRRPLEFYIHPTIE
jgi:peptide deformylase